MSVWAWICVGRTFNNAKRIGLYIEYMYALLKVYNIYRFYSDYMKR